MAEHDDAVSVMGDEEPRARAHAPAHGGNPLARAWAWFGVQPAQTKVIILGVIVVIGVVIYMALRNKNSQQVNTTNDQTAPGKFTPLGQYTRRHHRGDAASASALPSGPADGGINSTPTPTPTVAPDKSILPTVPQTPPQVLTPTPTPPVVQPVASAPVPAPTVTPGAMNLKGTNYEIDKVYQPTPIPAPIFTPSAPNKDETTTATLIYRAPAPAPTYTGAAPGKTAGATNQRGTNFLI